MVFIVSQFLLLLMALKGEEDDEGEALFMCVEWFVNNSNVAFQSTMIQPFFE